MMRPVRKSVAATNVTSKPLPVRSCAVRVVRRTESTTVSSTPVALPKVNSTSQSSWRNTSTPVHEERKFRGPLKKRPITELTTASPAKSSTNTNKRDVANKSSSKTPVTQLVAGRARRAIKPNPKYTSEDMVTPRILKTVTAGSKDGDNTMDDFFNRESSDEADAYLDDLIGKAFNDSDKEFTEYETVNLDNSKHTRSSSTTPAAAPATAPRKRGRPRREPIDSPVDTNASVVSAKTATTATAKNELLAKAISVRQKRPADKEPTEMIVTRKRFLYSANGNKIKSLSEYDNKTFTRSSSTATPIAAKPTATPINKTTSYRLKEILDEALGSDMEEIADEASQETPKPKDAQEQQENIALADERKKVTDAKVNTAKVVIKKTPPVLRTRMQLEHQLKNPNAEIETPEANNNKKLNENMMPTFTIVNINDIISKKGAALISKTSASSQDNVNNNKTQTTNGGQNNLQQRVLRKTTTGPTILNHQLANRQLAAKTNTTTATKQAPRILNAIVSKKMQPVKPTTQNPDDSAESFTLSLDEDEETDNEINKTFGSIGTDLSLTEAEEYSEEEHLTASSSSRKNAVTTKESSNQSLSPEQVEITRQGNKIVQKITCLENWYVISRKNKLLSPPVVRNQFEMPLINLANAATSLQLPSDRWSSKVTLYELPAATLAKGTFTTYTGNLTEHNISECDREKHQPSCVMFRRAAAQKEKSGLPYDRAVIFKNNTFYTNIDGKNVRLLAAPNVIDMQEDVEIMLDIMDTLSLQSSIVETTGSI